MPLEFLSFSRVIASTLRIIIGPCNVLYFALYTRFILMSVERPLIPGLERHFPSSNRHSSCRIRVRSHGVGFPFFGSYFGTAVRHPGCSVGCADAFVNSAFPRLFGFRISFISRERLYRPSPTLLESNPIRQWKWGGATKS